MAVNNADKENILKSLYVVRHILLDARRRTECSTMDIIALNRISAEIDYWECCDLPLTVVPGYMG